MSDSIMSTVKSMLGVPEDNYDFDLDIKVGVNSALAVLAQHGVGQVGFVVSDNAETWQDFVDIGKYPQVKSIVYLRTRLFFDPPQNSFNIDAIRNQIEELEWRVYVMSETTEGVACNDTTQEASSLDD